MEQEKYLKYVSILDSELLPAFGCTEPVAVAYAAARARAVLGRLPERVNIKASGNIIKNAKSVIVPNSGGRRGIEAAAGLGIVAGNPDRELQVISEVGSDSAGLLERFLERASITVGVLDSELALDILVVLSAGEDSVRLRLAKNHTNIVYIEKNGEVLLDIPCGGTDGGGSAQKTTLEEIFEFSNTCCISDIHDTIARQIEYNTAIAEEGLRNDWGANIGSTVLKYEDGALPEVRGKAMAAAGSDARMSGCELPVVINSGSGNQGLTVSLPVIEYARHLNCGEEMLFRSLAFANLVGIHIKANVGRLSAYCGAISAGCAAGAGISYMTGADLEQISRQIINCLAITSGIVCDGAKPSCAAKIAIALDAAALARNMVLNGQQFCGGDGFVQDGVENTIKSVAEIARDGMRETDRVILKLMTAN